MTGRELTAELRAEVFERCRAAVPAWRELAVDDATFDPPKGFSSFTMGVHVRADVDPRAVLYRHLDGKENAILETDNERAVFLSLGEAGIAPHCLAYERNYRIEQFYAGRTLTADDVFDPAVQHGVAEQLHRLHHHDPGPLPEATYFELLHEKWGRLARHVLDRERHRFPDHEAGLCDDLYGALEPTTLDMAMRCLPAGEPTFCHNDTYHGNVFLLDDGSIRLLDFEFACRNHIAFDFANFFAETVMLHGFDEPPHFQIGEPRFTDADLASMIGHYVALDGAADPARVDRLVGETRRAIILSDLMYTLAAIPLAVEPVQRIRFLPYAHARFARFRRAWAAEFS